MFILLPYHVDVPMRGLPWMNWVLIGVTVLFYPLCGHAPDFTALGEELMLGKKTPLGILGHVLVHADLVHLLGNMLFLWVFGNAVCAKVGNLTFVPLYAAFALAAGVAHLATSSLPAAGASGAINGVVGVFVIWYLLNDISCWYAWWTFNTGDAGTFSVSSFWMVLLWLAFDVWGLVRGGGGVAYTAHLGGLAAGLIAGVALLKLGWVRMDRGERSLLQLISGEEEEAPRARRRA